MGSIKEIYRYNGSSWVRLQPIGSDFLTEPSFVGSNSINNGNVNSGVTPTTKGMYATTSANKLAFLPPEQIYIERSTDGGETFEYFPLADALKGRLFDLQTSTSTCNIPTINGVRDCNAITRITITCNHYNYPETATPETFKDYWTYDNFIEDERYILLNQFYIFLSSVADRVWLKIEVSNLGNPGSWRTVWDTTTNADNLGLSGWSGGNSINFPGVAFGGSLNQQSGALTSNCSFIRFTFRTMTADPEHPFDNAYLSSNSTSSTQTVYFVAGYGLAGWQYSNNMMKLGQIYTWDYQQNVSFPGNIYPSDNASAWNTAVSSIGASSKRFHDIWVSLVHSFQVEAEADIKERGTYLYNRYLGYVNDSNNYPAPALVNKNIITAVSYLRTGTAGILPYTLNASGGGWTNATCSIGNSDYRFGASYIANMYANVIQASTSIRATQIYENGSPLEDRYLGYFFNTTTEAYKALCTYSNGVQTPIQYLRAGTAGIVPYSLSAASSATDWTRASGQIGTSTYRFYSSYIKDMYADVISADNQVSAVRFIENGTNLSNKYAQKATTLSGYGITDCKIQGQTIQIGSNSIAVPEPSGEVLTTIWTGNTLIVGSATSMTSSSAVSITLNDYFQNISKLRFYFINSGTYANYTSFVCDMIIYPNDATPSDYCGMASININNGAWAGFISFAVDPVDTSRNKINLSVFTFKWDTASGAPASLRDFHLTKVDKVN